MPTDAAIDIVNAIFAGQKDLSDFVDVGMKLKALDEIGQRKVDLGKLIFNPDTPEETESEEDPDDETN